MKVGDIVDYKCNDGPTKRCVIMDTFMGINTDGDTSPQPEDNRMFVVIKSLNSNWRNICSVDRNRWWTVTLVEEKITPRKHIMKHSL